MSENFEPFMGYWFIPQRGQIVLDVGAHIGAYTLRAAKVVGERGRVIALEPNPVTFQLLLKNIQLNSAHNVTAIEVAAWNQSRELKLYHASHLGLCSVKIDYNQGYAVIKAKPITEIFRTLGLSRVDLTKIDTEGAEREVLEGMSELIGSCPQVVVEVNSANLDWLTDFAEESGYGLVCISHTTNNATYFVLKR